MTATELQNIARVMANNTWCRYWLNFENQRKPVLMAIQCRDEVGRPHPIADMERLGFVQRDAFLYTITRTNEDGSDFESRLF